MKRLFPDRSSPRAGVGPVVVVVVLIIGVFLLFLIIDYALSPDSVSITGPATIAGAGPATYTVTVTFDDTSSAARTLEVLVYEDDFSNDLLASGILVTVPAGSNSGSAAVALSCTGGALTGPNGSSDVEATYQVFALYDRVFPLRNVASANIPVTCGPAVPLAPVPPGGAPVIPPGGGGGDGG